tara:strand:- start:190 stop:354 length:165 start_codon:yes stop_codon:yes gene_type:complete
MTIIEHIKKEIKRLEYEINIGSSKNARNHLDGYSLKGLKEKKEKLKKCLNILLK